MINLPQIFQFKGEQTMDSYVISCQENAEGQPLHIQYQLLYSLNDCFEEFELWEYGILCKMYNDQNILISSARVQHISKDKSYVISLMKFLAKHKVFPVHLYDIVYDELVKILEN